MAAPILQYAKAEVIGLKGHPLFTEAWVRDRIVADPAILGLGDDLVIRAIERFQPGGGKLDLLLQDEEGVRYAVEIMLGEVDACHIINTLEYWDNERRRYPLYEHRAVLIAERVAGRFLNVIGLFNNAIPLIALQMTALAFGGQMTLQFTKILDVVEPELEDEDSGATPSNRDEWLQRAPKSVPLADQCLLVLQGVVAGASLKYYQQFVGLIVSGAVNNFVVFVPKKQFLSVQVKIEDRQYWKDVLEEMGILVISTSKTRIRFRLTPQDVTDKKYSLKELFETAYKENS
jgi:hypothetical protein